ncbi:MULTISPECIES: RNA polymerase sigma factor [Sphingobacterium]|uniref:RNA polymerase sigma factor n=1 Tax=Sphingobacterium TaxID=28453 RepID=UPI0013DA2427|nr:MULTISPECIES: RNA polymerase sigma-70 factor [unclassified Sphingobacterium]
MNTFTKPEDFLNTQRALDDSEQYLLEKLRLGNNMAFSILYERYYAQLYLHAYQKIKDREVAKDIVHDLFTYIWDKREKFQIKDSLTAYLYQSVRNRVINYVANQNVSSSYIQSFGQYLNAPANTTDHLVREREFKALVEKEIEQLPPQIRKVFELSRKEYLSHKEIAEKLNLTEHTVRGYVKIALRALKLKFGNLFWAFL